MVPRPVHRGGSRVRCWPVPHWSACRHRPRRLSAPESTPAIGPTAGPALLQSGCVARHWLHSCVWLKEIVAGVIDAGQGPAPRVAGGLETDLDAGACVEGELQGPRRPRSQWRPRYLPQAAPGGWCSWICQPRCKLARWPPLIKEAPMPARLRCSPPRRSAPRWRSERRNSKAKETFKMPPSTAVSPVKEIVVNWSDTRCQRPFC